MALWAGRGTVRNGVRWMVVWGVCLVWPAVVVAQPANFLVPDSGSAAYDGYAWVAGDDLRIGSASQVAGNVRANEDVEISSEGAVVGDAMAAGLLPACGCVSGSVEEGAPLLVLPRLPSRATAKDMADKVFSTDTDFQKDFVVNGILFIDGDAVFHGAVNGTGTVIAAEDIRFEESSSATLQAGTKISFVAFGDIWVDRGRQVRGLLLAGDDLKVKRGASFEGVGIAAGTVDLDPGVLSTFQAVDGNP